MPHLTVNNINVTELLRKTYAKSGKGWLSLLETPIEESMLVNIEAIKVLQEMKYEGIYITLSKNYLDLSKMFQENGVDMDTVSFIDGISQMYGIRESESDKVKYIAGPLSIDAMFDCIRSIEPKMQQAKRFVFLDSITTILLYNSYEKTMQFSTRLSEMLEKLHLVGIVVSVSRGLTSEKLIQEFAKISDEVISLYEGA